MENGMKKKMQRTECVCLYVGVKGGRWETRALQGVYGLHTHSRGCVSEIAQEKKAQIQINIIIKSVINTIARVALGGLAHRSVTQGEGSVCCSHTRALQLVNIPAWHQFQNSKQPSNKNWAVLFTLLL